MENKTIEELFKQLDYVADQLEESGGSLEDSFKLYYEGMKLLKICNDKIDRIEKEILILDEK